LLRQGGVQGDAQDGGQHAPPAPQQPAEKADEQPGNNRDIKSVKIEPKLFVFSSCRARCMLYQIGQAQMKIAYPILAEAVGIMHATLLILDNCDIIYQYLPDISED
jgi:hypothetical protein